MRTIGLLFLLVWFSCAKPEQCQEATFEYYTNYEGYWNYCRYLTDEINPELKHVKTEVETICEGEPYYVGLDTMICNQTNCPRMGVINYDIRVIVK